MQVKNERKMKLSALCRADGFSWKGGSSQSAVESGSSFQSVAETGISSMRVVESGSSFQSAVESDSSSRRVVDFGVSFGDAAESDVVSRTGVGAGVFFPAGNRVGAFLKVGVLVGAVGVFGVLLGTGGCASALQEEGTPAAVAVSGRTDEAKGAALSDVRTGAAKGAALDEAKTGSVFAGGFAEALSEARAGVAKGLMRGAVFARGDGGAVGVVGEAVPGRPMTARTWFDIASVTKTFTAAAAALLVAEGKLVVDERLHRLATHTTTGRFKYDCANFVALGEAVERASGMRLDAFCRERIFRPLGMTRTTWGPVADDGTLCQMLPEGTPPGVVSDWRARAAGKPIGNAGAFSDVHDLRLFVTDLLTRKTFPEAYYDLLLTCRYEEEGGIRRSFGFDMSDTKRPAGLSRAAVFHSGWTGQTIVADPGTGFCGVVLTARTGDHGEAIISRNRILAALAAEFALGKSKKENR